MIEYKEPVPILNLEPSIQEPLYWKRPFDYLTLFYWILWYPQAITAYIEKGRPDISQHENHPVRTEYFQLPHLTPEYTPSNLGFIAYILWIVVSLLVNFGYTIANNLLGVSSISLGLFSLGSLWAVLTISVIYFYANAIALQLPYLMLSSYFTGVSIWMGITLMSASVLTGPALVTWLGILFAIAIGFIIRIILLYSKEMLSDYLVFIYLIACMIVLLFVLFLQWLFATNSNFAISATAQSILLLILVTSVTSLGITLRLDDWFIGRHRWMQKQQEPTKWNHMPHVSLFPFPLVLDELKEQLRKDWKKGLRNAEKIIKYSGQKFYILNLIRELLHETPNKEAVDRVSALYDIPIFRNQILSLVPRTKKRFRSSFESWLSKLFLRKNIVIEDLAINRDPLSYKYEIDTPVRATIAGYQYLEQKYVELAKLAFKKVDATSEFGQHGRDLINLTIALLELLDGDDIALKAPLKMPAKPKNPKYTNVWKALLELRQFVRCMWVFRHSQELRDRRLIAFAAREHLDKALSFIGSVSEDVFIPFATILNEKATSWKREINENGEIPYFSPLDTESNPFAFMEPLSSAKLPFGRDKEKELLKEAWTSGNFQPILLYGQKHIGKTSVVFSMRSTGRSQARIVYINLKHLGVDISISKLLTAICEDIEHAIMYPAVRYEELIKTPYATFTAFIKRVCKDLRSNRYLVIVLDEIDHIETMSAAYDTQNNILKFLWETAQSIPNLGFVFITTKTPAEIYKDYSNPFGTGLSPIQIGFGTEEESANLLRNPTNKFLPYCLDEVLERVYQETNGHPYLTQIIAHSLVEGFNAQKGYKRVPLFTQRHVDDILKQPQFIRRLQHYCENVWKEVTVNDPLAGIALLYIAFLYVVLSEGGLSDSEVRRLRSHIDKIEKLENHSVVEKREDNQWYVSVQMFRQWINDCRKKLTNMLLPLTFTDHSLNCIQVESDSQRKAFCSLPTKIEDLTVYNADGLYIIQDENGIPLARCGIWYHDLPMIMDERIGLIGLYAAHNGIAGIQLLKYCYQTLREEQCERILGPVDGSLLNNFCLDIGRANSHISHFFTEPNTPLEYIPQFFIAGLQPTYRFHSLAMMVDEANNMFIDLENNAVNQSHTIRQIGLEKSADKFGAIYDAVIYPDSTLCSFNIEREDFINKYQLLLHSIRNSIALTIESDNHSDGFLFAIEENLQQGSQSEAGTLVVTVVATLPGFEHFAIALLYESWKYARRNGLTRIIIKQIFENGALSVLLQERGAEPLRRYALYSRAQ